MADLFGKDRKENLFAVGGPCGIADLVGSKRELRFAGAVGGDDEQFVGAGPIREEGDMGTIRRDDWLSAV